MLFFIYLVLMGMDRTTIWQNVIKLNDPKVTQKTDTTNRHNKQSDRQTRQID